MILTFTFLRKNEKEYGNSEDMIRNSQLCWFFLFAITSCTFKEVLGEFSVEYVYSHLRRAFSHKIILQQLFKTLTELITSISLRGYLNGTERDDVEEWLRGVTISDINEKVKFQLFNQLVPNGVFIQNPEDTNSTNFLQNAPIKIVTHGWLSGGNDDMCRTIKDQYLKTAKVNIIIVHWDHIAMSYLYLFVVIKLESVSAYSAEFLERLIRLKDLDPNSVHLIGHSLGAHLCGQVGKRLMNRNITIGRITGLDPAYPGYQDFLGSDKLSKNYAVFVDIVHTCGGSLGIMNPIGHVDFYPNGGIHPMPGCESFWMHKRCSHSRSWQYFAESIMHPFPAVGCETYSSFQDGKCSNEYTLLGEKISVKSRGRFYFNTNQIFPYNLGYNGTLFIPTPQGDKKAKIGSIKFCCDEEYSDDNKDQ